MGLITWIKSLFSRNGKVTPLEDCKEKTPTFKGKCVEHHSTKIQAQLAHINTSFDEMEEEEIFEEWTDPGIKVP